MPCVSTVSRKRFAQEPFGSSVFRAAALGFSLVFPSAAIAIAGAKQ